MSNLITDFDDKIEELVNESYDIIRTADLLDLHLLTLYQELIILKDFESVEEQLQERVNRKIEDQLDMQDLINEIIHKIEGNKREIDRLQEEEKSIQQIFFSVVADNKFYDFLRRIFKKKYRPPKIRNPDGISTNCC